MNDAESSKTITLQPSWKRFFIPYLLSFLTVPLVVGLIALYLIRKKHREIRYIIADESITVIENDISQNIDLLSIQRIELEKSWLDDKLGIGTIRLHTEMTSAAMKGLEDADLVKSSIERAAAAMKKLQQKPTGSKTEIPDRNPGSMERMDYLTGLWQQGLISDEQYRRERKNFE